MLVPCVCVCIQGDGVLIAIDNSNVDLATKSVENSASTTMSETEVAPLISHIVGALPMSLSVPKQVSISILTNILFVL